MSNLIEADTLAALVKTGMVRLSEDLHVAMPGQITEYDKLTRLATVQPLIMRRYFAKDEPQLLPVVKNVPIRQQRTQAAAVHLPPKPGDFVEMIFADRSLENWLDGEGEPREPLDLRKHNLSDAWALLDGGTPTSGMAVPSNVDNVVIKHGDCEIHIEESGLIHLGSGSAADFVALSTKVDDELKRIWDLLIGWTVLATDGGLALQTAAKSVYPSILPDTAATKTKAD